jgi:hypothetical protein
MVDKVKLASQFLELVNNAMAEYHIKHGNFGGGSRIESGVIKELSYYYKDTTFTIKLSDIIIDKN